MNDAFETEVEIVWGDLDALGHVNNVRYFEYFQEARIKWLREMHITMDKSSGPVLLSIGCTYFKPVYYPATLRIITKAQNLGRSSFEVLHQVLNGEILCAEAQSKIVWIDYKTTQSIPVPDVIRALFDGKS